MRRQKKQSGLPFDGDVVKLSGEEISMESLLLGEGDLPDMSGLDGMDLGQDAKPLYYFDLPKGGFRVACYEEDDLKLCENTLKPYLALVEEISSEDWAVLKRYLEAVILREKLVAEVNSPVTRKDLPRLREMRALLKDVQTSIDVFGLKFDPLRLSRSDDGDSPAEWRKKVEANALQYAEMNRGEHTWITTCPNRECRHHESPFMVQMEAPHWAFDHAAGPGVIWNGDIMSLVHKHYCKREECDHLCHQQDVIGSLALEDAARILRISPISILFSAYERKYDLGVDDEWDLDRPETLRGLLR